MANFTITTQAQTASVAMSTERLNQNWSDIGLGLTSGEKDIAIANATAARSVNSEHAVVASSVTASRGFVEQTATVNGMIEGQPVSLCWNGYNRVNYITSEPFVTEWETITKNGADWFVQQYSNVSYARYSYAFSPGDRIACCVRKSATTHWLGVHDVAEVSGHISPGYQIAMPRSGSVIGLFYAAKTGMTPPFGYYIWNFGVTLHVVFDT